MVKYKIPEKLQKKGFRFVKLKEKIPFETAWQKKGYAFDDPKLLKHLENKQNIGVIGGYGRLRIQDIDDKKLANELINKFNTFTVRTGSGGCHLYFLSDLETNFVLKDDLGEFRGKDYQVVCGNMKHPNGNFYKVEKDLDIREISQQEIMEILKPYLRDKELKTYHGEIKTTFDAKTGLINQTGGDESRSAFEYRRVLSMLRQNKTKEQIFTDMQRYSKWVKSPEQYKELTYNKACEYAETQQVEEEEQERIKIMDYKGLMNYQIEPVNWLIKDQIPKGEVGFLVGKRGEKKTWTALKQTLALCSGKDCFNDEVPEKKKVMIIDEESGENILAKRLQLLAKADGIIEEDLELTTFSFAGLKLDQPESKKYQEFAEIVEQIKPDLIIVDCFQRVVSFDVDKDNSLISGLFTGTIRPMINNYGMTWLFVHHLRKSPTGNNTNSDDPLDEVRGGSELVNYARFVLSCSSPKHQSKTDDGAEMLVFKVLKMSNSTIPEPKVLMFRPNHADPEQNTEIQMNYLGKVEDVLRTEARVGNAIKDFLFEQGIKGEFEAKLIMTNANKIGFKETFLKKGLKELKDTGFLDSPKRGKYIIAEGVEPTQQKQLIPKEEIVFKKVSKEPKEEQKDISNFTKEELEMAGYSETEINDLRGNPQ